MVGHFKVVYIKGPFSTHARTRVSIRPSRARINMESAKGATCLKVLVTQLCLTLCDSMDCSSSGSSVRGILQARILEWVAVPFSRGFFRPRDWTWVSHIAGRFFTFWTTRIRVGQRMHRRWVVSSASSLLPSPWLLNAVCDRQGWWLGNLYLQGFQVSKQAIPRVHFLVHPGWGPLTVRMPLARRECGGDFS